MYPHINVAHQMADQKRTTMFTDEWWHKAKPADVRYEEMVKLKRHFLIYKACALCTQSKHIASECNCACHPYSISRWLVENADKMKLEVVAMVIELMESMMFESPMPPRLVEEIKQNRDRAFESAAVKPL